MHFKSLLLICFAAAVQANANSSSKSSSTHSSSKSTAHSTLSTYSHQSSTSFHAISSIHPTHTSSSPSIYACPSPITLSPLPSVVGSSYAPPPNPPSGFKLHIVNFTKNVTANLSVVDLVYDDGYGDSEQPHFGHGAVGYWPNWPEAVLLQSKDGRLSIADAVTASPAYLSVGVDGANMSMRETLAKGENWLVCDTLVNGDKVSCRTGASGNSKGFKFWSPSNLMDLCLTNFGPAVSTQFRRTQPPTLGVNPETNVPCDSYGSFELTAIEVPAPRKHEWIRLTVKTENPANNGLNVFPLDYDGTWFFQLYMTGVFSFSREFYSGVKRLLVRDGGSGSLDSGAVAVDLSMSPNLTLTSTLSGQQRYLECLVNQKTREMSCSVDGTVYPFHCPYSPSGRWIPENVVFGPCVPEKDIVKGNGEDYKYSRECKVFAEPLYHLTNDLNKPYVYGG